MITELKTRCALHLQELNDKGLFESVKPFNVITAITASIEIIASKTKLSKLESNLKTEFKDIFQPIPHIDLLPTTETACIWLKDKYKKIANRTYSIPRQFRESFAILIQKCLDSGFI